MAMNALENVVFAHRAKPSPGIKPIVLHACHEPIATYMNGYAPLSGYTQAITALDEGLQQTGSVTSFRVVPGFTYPSCGAWGSSHYDRSVGTPLFEIKEGGKTFKIAVSATADFWDSPIITLSNVDDANYFAFKPYCEPMRNYLLPGRFIEEKTKVFNAALFELAKAIRAALAGNEKLIFHGHDHLTGLAVALSARAGIPTAFTVHNPAYTTLAPLELINGLGFELPADHNPVDLLWLAIAHAHMVTTVSPTYQSELTSSQFDYGPEHQKYGPLFREKLARGAFKGILNGLMPPFLAKQTEARPKPDGVIRVLFANRLVPQKGYDLLMNGMGEAVAALRQAGIRAQFTVMADDGDQSIRDALTGLSRSVPEFKFESYWYEDNMLQALAKTDLALMPSRFEPCGQFLMAAQAQGVLALGAGTGGLNDVLGAGTPNSDILFGLQSAGVQMGKYGLIFPSSPSQPLTSEVFWRGLRATIEILNTQPSDLRRQWLETIAVQGRYRARAHYTPERMATEYSQVYESLLKQA